ncbi:hypothetical protein RQP46_002187 [Phenoliferia psychrophenolica]
MSCPDKVDAAIKNTVPIASEDTHYYDTAPTGTPRPVEGGPEACSDVAATGGTADPIEEEKGSDLLPAPSEAELHAEHMYARFTEGRKRVILGIVAFAALLAPFSFSSFLPSFSLISDDLHTTPTIINISVATFIVMIGITPLCWSVLSRICALIGASLAPIFGGLLTQYVHDGWRAMQYLLMAMGALVSLLVFFFLPETAHSRGVDFIISERKERKVDSGESKAHWWTRWTKDVVFVAFNPLAPIALLKHPHILAMVASTSARRHQGLGNLIASRLIGLYCDYTIKRWKKKRQGVYVPEDRLRASLIGGGFVFPVSVVSLGWTLEKGSGKGGIAAAVILLTLNGIGLMVMQDRSAEVIAVNNAVRYILSGAASAFALPLIDVIGAGWANTFAACLTWLGFGLVLLTIRYGERMRSWRA